MNENIKVNDGKGLLDNSGLCDSLIKDLNRLPQLLIDQQFILFCTIVSQMGQKLINLKNGIDHDMKSKDETIEQLKSMLKASGTEIVDNPPLSELLGVKDGENNGEN